MKKKIILSILIGIILTSGFIFALQLTTFNNNLSEENLTFTDDENFTRYLNVSRYVNFTSAVMNMSGFLYNVSYSPIVFNTTAVYSANWLFDGLATDGNWGTNSLSAIGQPVSLLQNFTITNNQYENLTWKIGLFADGISAPTGPEHYCWNTSDEWKFIAWYAGGNESLDQNWTYDIPSDCVLTGNIVVINTTKTGSADGAQIKIYESQLQWDYATINYTKNASLEVGNWDGIKEWEAENRNYTDAEEGSTACAEFIDEDFATCCTGDFDSNYDVNYTLPYPKNDITNLTIQYKIEYNDSAAGNFNLYIQNWTNGSNLITEGFYHIVNQVMTANTMYYANVTIQDKDILEQILEDGQPVLLRYYLSTAGATTVNRFEDAIFFEASGQNFTGINQTTDDFALEINSALNGGECDCVGCSIINGNCSIPFIFHSNTGGILEYSSIDFEYNNIIIPNFTINTPLSTGVNLNSVLNVTILNSSTLDYCYYNITRGASTEVSNTNLSCVNFTDDITVSSYSTTYFLNLFANYTDGFINTTSYSFTTKADPNLGGGGSGTSPGGSSIATTIIIGTTNETQWSMTTQDGSSKYTFKMSEGSSRERLILFENLGTSDREITLRCEPVNNSDDLCKYLLISDEEFTLPAAKNTTLSVNIELILPENLPEKLYRFNIIGKDDLNQEGIVTIEVDNDLSVITETLVKLISNAQIAGIKIPYVIIFLFGLGIFGVGSYYAGVRKSKGGAAISFMIGLILSFMLIFFI